MNRCPQCEKKLRVRDHTESDTAGKKYLIATCLFCKYNVTIDDWDEKEGKCEPKPKKDDKGYNSDNWPTKY